MTRIERLAWEGGKHIPTHILDNMSESEMQYFKKYLDNLEAYNKSVSGLFGNDITNLDSTVDFNPPKDLFIEVRVNKDYGTINLPDSGEVILQKSSTHLLRRSEADHLIKRGIIAEVV